MGRRDAYGDAKGAGLGWDMHLSDSRLASSRKGFRYWRIDMVDIKEEKKVESA